MEHTEYRKVFVKSGATIISIWYFLLFYKFPTGLSVGSPDDFEIFGPFPAILALFALLYLIGSAALFLSKIYTYLRDYSSSEKTDGSQNHDPLTLLTNHYLFNIKRLVILTVLVTYTNIFNRIYRFEIEAVFLSLISFFIALFLADVLINKLVVGNKSLISYKWSFGSWISLAVALIIFISLIADFGGLLSNSMKLARSLRQIVLLLKVLEGMDLGAILAIFVVFILLLWTVLRVIFEWRRLYNDFFKALGAVKENLLKIILKLRNSKKATIE